jgi:hypothetical protein
VTLEFDPGDATSCSHSLALPYGWSEDDGQITISSDANQTDPYRAEYDPADPPLPRIDIQLETTTVSVPFDIPPVVLPDRAALIAPDAALINLKTPNRSVSVAIADVSPAGAKVSFDLPDGWSMQQGAGGIEVNLPDEPEPGRYTLPLFVGNAPAMTEQRIAHDHVDPTVYAQPAALSVRVLDVALPQAKVGYIGSGHDAVADWLTALGADVTALTDDQITSDEALAGFDTIVVGIFALRFRDGLVSEMPRLREWVEQGGTLVTLYHRPWDNWDPDTVSPRKLEIGQPSLRWRVTDAEAEVTHLTDHPLLSTPNAITVEDWDGWVKERGLYFAKSWDDAYTPLLSMSDPDEAPLTGALLTADIGKGRHTHCSLILHHQMAKLVPGAFRLMANLIAPRR